MNSIPFHSGPIASHDQFDDFDELNEPPLLEGSPSHRAAVHPVDQFDV